MKLSVVIPTLNEEANIGGLVHWLRNDNSGLIAEILVVDGGSTDATVRRARFAGAQVLQSPQRGRAHQLHLGAQLAKGHILYFLHADSLPPTDFARTVVQAVEQGSAAGAFRLAFDSPQRMMRLYGWFSRMRWRIARGGDASLFVTQELYQRIGGFNTRLPVMEDIDIVQRLGRQTRFCILPQTVTTSARRYHRKGVLRLQLLFGMMHLGYWLGISPGRLGGFYRKFIEL